MLLNELTYLASPYSDDDFLVEERRYRAVAWEAARLINDGQLVFCPITHSHPIATIGSVDGGWKTWARQDFALLQVCKTLTILCLEGWQESTGVTEETKRAIELHMPIIHLTPHVDNPFL